MPEQDRQAARGRLSDLITMIRALPADEHLTKLLEEAEALDRAIAAFHLEGIRFRMYNVDRMVARGSIELPADVSAAVRDIHHHLAAAGFHTRSHSAPTQ
jgi:hypothetical protein